MNRKGFTLVELLALIGLLTIVVLIATPNIINQIDSQKSRNYENFIGDLCLSTEAYINHGENIEGIDDFNDPGDAIEISMNDLIVNGYVKSTTKNPKTKENIKTTDHVLVTINHDKTYSCELNGIKPVPQPVSFADDDWSVIAANTTSDKYNVGDTKCVALDGLTTTNDNGCNNGEFKVRIANKTACTTEESQTACGFVVEFVDVIETRQMNSSDTNVDGYPASALYQEYFAENATNSLYAKLPSDLQSAIIDTTVVSGHGSTTSETNFSSTDKLYLLSTKEVGFNESYDTAKEETRILDYYNINNNNASRIKQYNGSQNYWWLRSAHSGSTRHFCYVSSGGSYYGGYAADANGVAPAFRIGS